jgi:hypothetical protein
VVLAAGLPARAHSDQSRFRTSINGSPELVLVGLPGGLAQELFRIAEGARLRELEETAHPDSLHLDREELEKALVFRGEGIRAYGHYVGPDRDPPAFRDFAVVLTWDSPDSEVREGTYRGKPALELEGKVAWALFAYAYNANLSGSITLKVSPGPVTGRPIPSKVDLEGRSFRCERRDPAYRCWLWNVTKSG